MEEFKYLRILFGVMEQDIDKQIAVASAVMWVLYRYVVMKMELSQNVKLSIYLLG